MTIDLNTLRGVGLWGHNGTGNMGNEATLSALIQNLRMRSPGISLYGYSWNPQDTFTRHGIISFPINRRSSEVYKAESSTTPTQPSGYSVWKKRLKRSPAAYKALRLLLTPLLEMLFFIRACRSIGCIDLMLVAGTGQIADTFGGFKNYPYSLFRWSICCRIKGVKMAAISVGAGPIKGYLSKKLIKIGLAGCSYRSFRDEYSKKLVEALGVQGENRVYPDLVFGLDLPAHELKQHLITDKIVAFNALPYREPGAWENPNQIIYQGYCQLLVRFVSWLLKDGYFVHLVPTQAPMDVDFLEGLRSKVATGSPDRLLMESPRDPSWGVDDIISQFAKTSMVVTTRFHGVVFPFLLGKPVLALSYHPKMTELMRDFGQARFCFDIESLDFGNLVNGFKDLESMQQDASKRIRERVEFSKRLLDKQYQELMQL